MAWRRFLFSFLAFLCNFSAQAGQFGAILYGSVGPYAEFTAGGHGAIYLANICMDTPTRLRRCDEGELGSVLARYDKLPGQLHEHDWLILPFLVHVYGTETIQESPLIVTTQITNAIRENARKKYFPREIPPTGSNRWGSLVGAAHRRGMDIVVVEISSESENELIEHFNADPNQHIFQSFIRNCSNFQNEVLNLVLPNSSHRSIKDFGMMSPIAATASFAKFALKRPELLLRINRVSQMPGTYRTEMPVRFGMDNFYRHLKYLPLLVVLPKVFGFMSVVSIFDRFNIDKERQKNPDIRSAEIRLEIKKLKESKEPRPDEALESQTRELEKQLKIHLDQVVNSKRNEYESYRQKFYRIVESLLERHLISPRQAYLLKFEDKPQKYLKDFEGTDVSIEADHGGALTLVRIKNGSTQKAGLSELNIENYDRSLGLEIIMGGINYILRTPEVDRPSIQEFERYWQILTRLLPFGGTNE